MAKPYPTKNCRDCGCSLDGIKRNGARCMQCYSKVITERRKALKSRAVTYHGNKCADCGGVFHQCVYDFHHVNEDRNNDRERTIGQMCHQSRPWSVIKEELDQCVMLCANCHRLRHFED